MVLGYGSPRKLIRHVTKDESYPRRNGVPVEGIGEKREKLVRLVEMPLA